MPDPETEEQQQDDQGTDPEPDAPEPTQEDEGTVSLSRDQLPEALQDVPEDQLPQTLSAVTAALNERQRQLEALQSGGQGQDGSQPEPQLTSEQEQELEELEGDLQDEIYDNPEEAIEYVVRKKFGDALQSAQSTSQEAYEAAAMLEARQRFPDFDEHEDTVRQVLEQSGAPATRENVEGAYVYSVGQQALEQRQEERKREAKKQVTSEEPDKTSEEDTEEELTGVERQVASRLGMSEDEYREYRDTDTVEVEVPTG